MELPQELDRVALIGAQTPHLGEQGGQQPGDELLAARGGQVGHVGGVRRVVREVVRRQLRRAKRRQPQLGDAGAAFVGREIGQMHGRLAALGRRELQRGSPVGVKLLRPALGGGADLRSGALGRGRWGIHDFPAYAGARPTDGYARTVRFPSPATLRGHIPDMNDGIIATAGVIEGFIAAGAGSSALLAASIAVTIAGAGALGGVKFDEASAERDAELAVIAEEKSDIARDPEAELAELAEHFEGQGLTPHLAMEVARQVSDHDALAAQLEVEHGIRDRTPASEPYARAFGSAFAFLIGGTLPVAIVLLAPPNLRAVATVVAVLISLALTAIITARLGRASVWRTITRSLAVGALTLLLSVLAGSFLPDPDGGALGAANTVLASR